MELYPDVVGAGSDILHRINGVRRCSARDLALPSMPTTVSAYLRVAIGGGNQIGGGSHLDLEVVGVGAGLEPAAER